MILNNIKNFRSHIILLFIATLCALPYLSAQYFYHHPSQPVFTHYINHGTLINQPPRLSFLGIVKNDNWLLLYVQPQSCDQTCMMHLRLLSQIRLAFGEKSRRISYGLLTTDPQPMPLERSAQRYQIEAPLYRQWVMQFPSNLQQQISNSFVICDPTGNVILHYPSTIEPKALYQDLKRLLGSAE